MEKAVSNIGIKPDKKRRKSNSSEPKAKRTGSVRVSGAHYLLKARPAVKMPEDIDSIQIVLFGLMSGRECSRRH